MTLTDYTVPEAAPAPACGWGAPAGIHEISCDNGALRLQLSRSSLYRMDAVVREGFRTVAAVHGVEMGGILIGTLAPDHSIVRLLDVVPIEIEHLFGPAFRPSEADLQNIGRVIAEHSNGPRSVIGYFRGHLQENTASLRAEDEQLLKRFFAGCGCSVILVQPDAAGQTTALFCQWDGGDGVRLVERIPLVTKQIYWEADRQHTGRASDAMELPPARENESGWNHTIARSHDPYQIASTPFRFGKAAMLAFVAVALAAVFALGRFTMPRKTAPVTPALDLTVAVHGGIVDVKWNARSSEIGDSVRGTLDFVDGADLRRIELNEAQLRAGHYEVVAPQHDLTCLMTVYRKHDVFVGETKSVHRNLPQSAGVLPPVTRQVAPVVTASVVPEKPVEEKPAAKPPVAHSPPSPAVVSQKAAQIKKPVVARTMPGVNKPVYSRGAKFTPPPIRDSVAPVPRVEDPPKIETTESRPPVASVPSSPLRGANIPPVAFVEATPISRVKPVLSPAEKHAIFLEVSIRVAVKIDRKGRVTSAYAIDPRTTMEKLLAPHAVEAARLWRFDPARRDGMPVASETVLVFPFPRS